MARNARLDEERRHTEEETEGKRKTLEEGGRRGSAIEVLAGVINPTFEGMGLNKVKSRFPSPLPSRFFYLLVRVCGANVCLPS